MLRVWSHNRPASVLRFPASPKLGGLRKSGAHPGSVLCRMCYTQVNQGVRNLLAFGLVEHTWNRLDPDSSLEEPVYR